MANSLAKTPAPAKDRIYGSKVNPKGSASSEKSAKNIQLSAKTILALSKKLKEFKETHNTKKVSLNDLKAVYRRGLGAYSSTHRPTITGGVPNTRNAWAMARVNAFLRKAGGGESKKAYVQDDDLLKYDDGGEVEYAGNKYLQKKYSKLKIKNPDFEDLPEIYVRFRKPRMSKGKVLPSLNHITKEKEKGVSVFTARYSPNSGFVFIDLNDAFGNEEDSGYSIERTYGGFEDENLYNSIDIYLVDGKVVKGNPSFIKLNDGKIKNITEPYMRGADGERLLNTEKFKIIGKLDPDKIVADKSFYSYYKFSDKPNTFSGNILEKYPKYDLGGEIESVKDDNFVSLKYIEDGVEKGHLDYTYSKDYVMTDELGYPPYNYKSEIYIEIVEVDENERHKGIAKKLFKRLIQDAKELNVDVITLRRDSGMGYNYGSAYDTYLKNLYSSFGFVETFTAEDEEKSSGEKSRVAMHLSLKNSYESGGSVDDKKETYKKWKSLVNMSYSELEKFYNSKEGKEAGLSSSEAKAQGISSGRESARMILKMKSTPNSKWTDNMWKWANKQISFISRMSGMKGDLYDDKGNKTRKHTSLLIWGHNPKKYNAGGETSTDKKFNDPIIYHEKNGNVFVGKNTIYFWLYDNKDAGQKLNDGEYDFVMFPPATLSMAMQKGFVPPLQLIWRKKYQKNTKGSEHLIGIIQAYYDEENKKMYIKMMTSHPKMRGKGIMSYMVKELRNEFGLSQDDLIFVDTTKEGKQFEQAKHYEEGGNIYENVGFTQEQIENWKNEHRVSQRQKQNPNVKESAIKLQNGEISQDEYIKSVRKYLPIVPFKEVPQIPTLLEIVGALDSSKVEKGIIGYTKFIEDGEDVATRLDIPAYEGYDVWVVSVHDGVKEKIIAYGQTALLKDVTFLFSPKKALRIATELDSKNTFARMRGTWINKDPHEVREMAVKYMNDPEWVQVGMNPYRHSWFYDKTDGMPLLTAEEVIQVGALVLAKNPVKTTPDNPIFTVPKSNPEIKFEDGGEIESYKNDLSEKIGKGNTISTKEFATIYGISTSKAYDILTKLEKENFVFKYGYKTKYGWEDINDSNLKPNSLYWQVSNEFSNGGYIAPNGKPSNLTPEQYELVRTPEFKSWFGDWENDPANASKVVDENGEPLVVYHGTMSGKFNIFLNEKSIDKLFYFHKDKKYAIDYSRDYYGGTTENSYVFEVFLNLRNPLNGYKKYYEDFGSNDGADLRDGRYIVLSSNQIKLADGTNTTFDGSNPDIRFKRGGGIQATGDCYETACKFAMPRIYRPKDIDFIGTPYLVQAEVQGQGAISHIRYGHAFIEDDENVYDFSNGRELIIPKFLYYQMGDIKTNNPKKYRKYTFEEARKKMLETGHYGHWELDVKYRDGGIFKKHKTIEQIAKEKNVSLPYAKNQLKKGMEVESEHSNSKEVQETIALQHLDEMIDYYDKLKTIEK